MPIDDYPIQHRVNTGITYSQLYEQWTACVAARLDLYDWVFTQKYPGWFKAFVVRWYGDAKLIEAAETDAQNIEMARRFRNK